MIVVAVADLLARTRIVAAARAAGHEVTARNDAPPPEEPPPALLVADLDQPGMLDGLERYRDAHPEAAIAGFAFHVHRDVLDRARSLGVRTLPHGTDPGAFFGNPASAPGV